MLRRAMKEPEEDVQYAMLAVHFGDFVSFVLFES